MSRLFYDHKNMKLEVSYRKKTEKKKSKQVETKQHAAKKIMGQLSNQRGNQRYFEM